MNIGRADAGRTKLQPNLPRAGLRIRDFLKT
jgi:hypothetical protein